MTERLDDGYAVGLEPFSTNNAVLASSQEVLPPYSEPHPLINEAVRLSFRMSLTDKLVVPRVNSINTAYQKAVTTVTDYLLEYSREAYPGATRYRDTMHVSSYRVRHIDEELEVNLAEKLMHEPTEHYDTGHLRNFRVQTVSPDTAHDLCDERWDLSVSRGTRNGSLPEFTMFLLASADAHVGSRSLGVGYLAQIALAGNVTAEERITNHGLFQGHILPRDKTFLLTKRATENSLPLSTGTSRGRESGRRRFR